MSDPVRREAARVLLIDPDERLLLIRFCPSRDHAVPFWCPVGGGLDAGETAAEAAVREVGEETGQHGVQLGPECFTRTVQFTWRDVRYDQSERWFVAYVPHFEVDPAGWTEAERDDITDVRWFSAADLAACDEALVPLDLAAVYATLLADGPPEAPVALDF